MKIKKIYKIIKSNINLFGIRYFLWDIPYQFCNFIYAKNNKKEEKKTKNFIEKKVNDYKMILNKNGEGIERDLILNGTREPISTKIMESWCKKGDVVLDLGANIGYYTILISKKVGKSGKIYAIEPGKDNYSLLKKNIKLNNLKNVCDKQAAFADYDGELKLYVSDAGNYNSPVRIGKNNKIEKIPCYKLDTFFKNRKKPKIIKMDVEGYEFEILMGGKKTLQEVKKIFVELHFSLIKKGKMISLLKMLKKQGFEISKMILEWERNVEEDKFLGKIVNWLYKKRSKEKIYSDITLDKLINDNEILDGHLSYEVFLEKK